MAKQKGGTEVERRREQFILAYAVTGNATAAAVAAGYSPKTAKTQGSFLLTNPEFAIRARDARETHLADQQAAFERQTALLRSAGDQAILTLQNVAANARSEMARVQAAVAILDRAGHKPIEKVDSTNHHTFAPPDPDEVDARIDKLFGPGRTLPSASGDSKPTH